MGALVLTAGCDETVDRLMRWISTRDQYIVVLASNPVTLTDKPTTFSGPEPLRVVGESTFLCLVIRDGEPLQSATEMEKNLATAMGGAKVRVDVLLDDGNRVRLHEPLPAWSLWGVVLPKNEMSGCASASCGPRLPVGRTVKGVELSSSQRLEVRGIFWKSEQSIDEQYRAGASGKPSAESSRCAG